MNGILKGTEPSSPEYVLDKRRLLELTAAVTNVSACLEDVQVAQMAAAEATRLLQADICVVTRWDPTTLKIALWELRDLTGAGLKCMCNRPERAPDCPYIRLLFKHPGIIQLSQSENGFEEEEREFFQRCEVKSLLLLPLQMHGRVEGMIAAIQNRREKRYHDLEILQGQLIASQTATSLENAILYQDLKQYSHQMETIYHASLHLTASLKLEEVLYNILESTLRLFQEADNAHVFLYEEGQLSFGAAQWNGQRMQEPWAKLRPHGLTYTVAQRGEMIVVPDMQSHPLYRDAPKDWGGAIVGLPLKIGDRVVGVMNTAFLQSQPFSDADLRLLRLLGDQAAIAIEKARLHALIDQLAHTDALTGLPNRLSFDEHLEEEIRRSDRYHHHFSLVMLDINNFKTVNDTFGHLRGDEVLKQVAQCLRGSLRGTDFVARYGGDEFLLIMPETTQDTATLLVERIRQRLADFPLVIPQAAPLYLTACFGLVMYPDQGLSAGQLLEQVDRALYENKRCMDRKGAQS